MHPTLHPTPAVTNRSPALHNTCDRQGEEQAKSHHLLCCQRRRCQDRCPHCPMFQAGGQNGFETSLTQLVSATPCQQTELDGFVKQDNGNRWVYQHGMGWPHSLCISTTGCQLTRWFGFDVSVWGCHSIQDNVAWLKWGRNNIIIQYRHTGNRF